MRKVLFLFLITTIHFQIRSQNTKIYDDLKTAFYYYEIAYGDISKGIDAINYCYSISNASELRSNVLYSCSYPANTKKNIDNAINQIYKAEQRLRNIQCPLALNYAKYSKELFESSRDNLKLGGLSLISASEERYTKNIYSKLSIGASYLNTSLKDLNNAIDRLNKIIDEMNNCSNSISENNSQSIECEKLIEFIEEEGIDKNTIYSSTLNSSWIEEVSKYEYKGNLYIIASLKENELRFLPYKKYIFCNIPTLKWLQFKNSTSGTYGLRFHNFIFSYKCECN